MSSIRKRFEAAQRMLNSSEEGGIEYLQKYCIEAIEDVLNNTKGQDVTFRCCLEIYTGEDGQMWIKCDTYNLPRNEFAKQCKRCAEEIESGLPRLKELYKSKLLAICS